MLIGKLFRYIFAMFSSALVWFVSFLVPEKKEFVDFALCKQMAFKLFKFYDWISKYFTDCVSRFLFVL